MTVIRIRRAMAIVGSVVGVLFTLALVDYLIQLRNSEGAVPPGTEAQIGGAFSLLDQTGASVTERNYADRYKLIFFGFTHCPDVCPTTLSRVSTILRELGPLADRVYPLFITVDPARDTPERLREYAKSFDPRIVYLTGSATDIERAMTAWRATRAKFAVGDDDYSMSHSAVLYLMAPAGALLKSYSWDTPIDEVTSSLKGYLAAP